MPFFSKIFKRKESGLSLKERVSAFQNLPRFFKMIWHTSRWMTLSNVLLRVVKAAIPVVMLWVGKLIIDEIILQTKASVPDYHYIWLYLGMEIILALLSDVINRGITFWIAYWEIFLVIVPPLSLFIMQPRWISISLKTASFTISWKGHAGKLPDERY